MKLLGLTFLLMLLTSCGDRAKEQAVALDALLANGRIDHFQCPCTPYASTNGFYGEVVPAYFHLFDADNRVQVPSGEFHADFPRQITFFSGSNAVIVLRYGNDVFAFGDYLFRLKSPKTFSKFFQPL